MAKTKQQIYEERVDRARNLGTYQTGVAILADENTQQSSNQPKKNNDKVCSSCGGTKHKTWQSKTCPNHCQYLEMKATKSTINKKSKSNTDLLTATGNNEEMVRINIGKKDGVSDGAKELLGEGGVDVASVEVMPLPVVMDDPASSNKKNNEAEAMCNFYEKNEVEKNKFGNDIVTLPVSRNVQCLPISTAVPEEIKMSISMDVDSTHRTPTSMEDSSRDLILHVKNPVQNFNIENKNMSDFEFDSDEDSEISFFTASSSVAEDGEAAETTCFAHVLKFNF